MAKNFLWYMLLSPMLAFAQPDKSASSFSAQVRGVDIQVEFYTPEIVRVRKTTSDCHPEQQKDFVVTLQPQQPEVSIIRTENNIKARSTALEVELDIQTGSVCFYKLDGARLLSEKAYGAQLMPVKFTQRIRPAQQATAQTSANQPVFTQSAPGQTNPDMGRSRLVVESTHEVEQSFILDEDEIIYGLGQHQDGLMSQRNQRLILEQNNMQISIPYFTSVKGYGLYWDNYSITTFDDTPMGTSFRSEAGEAIDYYFLYGKDGDGTVALLRQLSGQAPMVPLWTLGFWQCKERYQSKEEVVEVAEKYRALGIPLDAVVQDWKYWGEDNASWNALQFLNPSFTNPETMFDRLQKLHVKMMVSVWPSVGSGTDIYKELDQKNALYPMQTFPREARIYDVYNTEARQLFWEYMNKKLFQPGISAWWLDGSEPEFYNTKQGDFNLQTAEGPLRNVRNSYPLFVSKAIYESQRATTSEKRVYILTRSGFTGLQRYGAGTWSGDIRASWEVFRKQIPAGLNLSICGIPYWNTDIGAWHPFGYCYNTAHQDPGYQQIYCRWFQFATFNPMMRAHGTGSPREIYQFGERGYWAFDVQEQYLNLRYQLLPYLYSTAWQVTSKGYSYLRQLSMEAPLDKQTYQISDEFMFGQAFLVAPVVEENASSRNVYLPSGTKWIDFWNNQSYEGGQTIERETPIEIIPVFVKAGSILPLTTEKAHYATEKQWKKLELRVYPGADGDFTLYEDENDNYNYEQGLYSEIPVHWDETSGTLTIGNRKGTFPGMLKSRQFVITVVGKEITHTINYNGHSRQIKLID